MPARGAMFIFFLTSLLEFNCFTMVCQLLLYNKVNQLYIYIYPHISSLLLYNKVNQLYIYTYPRISSLLRLPPTLPIPPLLLGIYPEKTIIQKESCTPVFIAALFTIARTRKPCSFELDKIPEFSLPQHFHRMTVHLSRKSQMTVFGRSNIALRINGENNSIIMENKGFISQLPRD